MITIISLRSSKLTNISFQIRSGMDRPKVELPDNKEKVELF